jgi:hypothetical protein
VARQIILLLSQRIWLQLQRIWLQLQRVTQLHLKWLTAATEAESTPIIAYHSIGPKTNNTLKVLIKAFKHLN